MKYSDILRNEHFNNLAAIIRVPFWSEAWRKQYNGVPFWSMLNDLNEIKTEQHFSQNRAEFVARFCDLISSVTIADSNLDYTEADLAWFIQAMDDEHALAIASLLLAWASAPDELLTPAEVAEITGTADSTWRNKAAAGEIPGAVKKGKQWLLPRSVLRAQGADV